MADEIRLDLKIEDNSEMVLEQFERTMNKSLNGLGRAILANWDKLSRQHDFTKKTGEVTDTVDSGRYVAGQGAITPDAVIQGVPAYTTRAEDRLSGRAEAGTVMVATNVPYSQYLEFGTTRIPERKLLSRAVLDNSVEYKQLVDDIFSGRK